MEGVRVKELQRKVLTKQLRDAWNPRSHSSCSSTSEKTTHLISSHNYFNRLLSYAPLLLPASPFHTPPKTRPVKPNTTSFLSFLFFNHMASVDSEELAPQVQEGVDGATNKIEINNETTKNTKKKKKKKRSYFPRFGCFRIEHDANGESFDMEVVDASGHRPNPTHLIIMVNGLIGSAQNWKFVAKQFLKRYPYDAIVHCSECNSSMLTFDGVDVMGDRLAEEVISVIKRHPSVQKISFVGHSLGGLISRYAIAKLYERDISMEPSQGNGHCESQISDQECHDRKYEGKIAGLEPINFITSATPHLGCRGHKQVPLFCGFHSLEKTASRLSWFLGKTGKHLFLTDGKNGKPPLLLRMVRDSEDIKFMSALRSFKRHVAYANVRYDQLVGWSTSSIRRRNELPKRRHLKRHEKYPHIVNVESVNPTSAPEEVPIESKVSGGSAKIDLEGVGCYWGELGRSSKDEHFCRPLRDQMAHEIRNRKRNPKSKGNGKRLNNNELGSN